jgi:hypothetical protein
VETLFVSVLCISNWLYHFKIMRHDSVFDIHRKNQQVSVVCVLVAFVLVPLISLSQSRQNFYQLLSDKREAYNFPTTSL